MAHITVGALATRADFVAGGSSNFVVHSFEYFDETDINVYVNDVLQTLTTNYTVTPTTSPEGGFVGAKITFGVTPSLNDKIAVVLNMQSQRSTDFPTSGPFNITTLNTALDKIFTLLKQEAENLGRKIGFTESETTSGVLPAITSRANKLLSFDSNGAIAVTPVDSLSLATLQAFTDHAEQKFSGNASTTSFTLSSAPVTIANLKVFIDGVRQYPGGSFDYTLAGTSITFTTAPPSGTNNILCEWGLAAGTFVPPANTLTYEQLLQADIDTDLSSVSGSDDTLASAKSIKTYVDAQVTAQDLDFQGDSGGALNIDLDSETLDIAGGTGIDTTGSSNTLTVAIDSTVATLAGSQTLTNKTLTTPNFSGDTSAGDDAAIGYTSAAGLILTGQGSGADITIRNDAAATVAFVPTGEAAIRLPDSATLQVGSGADLQISHDGTDSLIYEADAGSLYISSNGDGIYFTKTNKAGENIASFLTDGPVTLYHNNAAAVTTSATGGTLAGTWNVTTWHNISRME